MSPVTPGHDDHTTDTPDGYERICWSCYTPLRPRRIFIACGECGHAYSRMSLFLANYRVARQCGCRSREAIRRPSRVWVCPCCAHDL